MAMGIAGVDVRAAIEKGNDGLPFRRPEALLTVVNQEGHGKPGVIRILSILFDLGNILPPLRERPLIQQSTEESAVGGGSHEGRLTRKQLQQPEAERLPALRFRRADVQVRNGVEAGEAPGICNPQGKDGELVIVTDKECANERFEGFKALNRRRRCVVIF